ncbi:hypothetical protein [Bradyrhizobium niftali]|jgi:hypothetical protein|uniref:Uncharacterized protein n=1 Tax=Bradyrhizobium niftali TaxID=2560055 RepID=A0A4Y9LY35_9BRAD|nr:hypothetical protein [Bradyrhizobium niftali]TFV47731.1 hypothetical protein E4K65_16000 [Bradyrhizobium niftali]
MASQTEQVFDRYQSKVLSLAERARASAKEQFFSNSSLRHPTKIICYFDPETGQKFLAARASTRSPNTVPELDPG